MLIRFTVIAASILGTSAVVAQDSTKDHIATDLHDRYQQTDRDCGGSKPAFMCSGILMRGAKPDAKHAPWVPSSDAEDAGGFPFSFLRTDAKFKDTKYSDGVVFYPSDKAPADRLKIQYRCGYPMRSESMDRKDDRCGIRPGKGANETQPCQKQKVLSGSEWVDKFKAGGFGELGKDFRPCAFSFDDSASNHGIDGAKAYEAVLDAIKQLGNTAFEHRNEVMAEAWPKDGKTVPPVEAFFFRDEKGPDDSAAVQAMRRAQDYQKAFSKQYKIWVPVVAIALPGSQSEDAKFHYDDKYQAIPPYK